MRSCHPCFFICHHKKLPSLFFFRMGLQGTVLLLLISTLSATATNITSENGHDQIGKVKSVFFIAPVHSHLVCSRFCSTKNAMYMLRQNSIQNDFIIWQFQFKIRFKTLELAAFNSTKYSFNLKTWISIRQISYSAINTLVFS